MTVLGNFEPVLPLSRISLASWSMDWQRRGKGETYLARHMPRNCGHILGRWMVYILVPDFWNTNHFVETKI